MDIEEENNLEENESFDEAADRKQENNIVNEISKSFLRYSMSVITSRAIPDLRDGLKPVQRRILFDMYKEGITPDKQHKKSATTVGSVMGLYHPHGDSSIYEAMVRMAQDFNYRYMLIDGHGNFGNVESSRPAAMRYTESRLSKISLEMLKDLNKDTVDMMPNYSEDKMEPVTLPSRFPNILVNGTMGIAVGMATNIPPHNLTEVINGCIAYIDNPEIDTAGLMEYVKGPDFPLGGIILGNKGIKDAYETGRGSLTIRSNAVIEEKGGRNYIVVDQIPYGVNTSELKQKVADLVKNKIIEGIADYHTDLKHGVKITITLKKDANPQVVLNQLYKHTDFQTKFGIIFLMLDNGVPRTLGLRDIIEKYIMYQKEVIVRRTKYDLKVAEDRVHILKGLLIAVDNIDEVVKIIRGAETSEEALEKLTKRFGLDEIQGNAILEMRLRKLTGLEREKIEKETEELLKLIEELKAILASDEKIYEVIKNELIEIRDKYGDERRTHIDMTAIDYIEDESLIPDENSIITLTEKGYIKRLSVDTYKVQNRGGKGIKGMSTNEEDNVKIMLNIMTHDDILFFTNKGKVYRIKGYEIPEFSRQAKGLPIINLLNIEKDEQVSSLIKITKDEIEDVKYLFFATKDGVVKRTSLEEFKNIRQTGKITITLKENDELIAVRKTTGQNKILLGSTNGHAVLFDENEVRVMGRTASGVRGINMPDGKCICCEVCTLDSNLLIVSEKGYGKRTFVKEFRETKRGSKGVKAINITEKNGKIAAINLVSDENDAIIITDSGMVIRIGVETVSQLSRNTQGVRLINLKDEQLVTSVSIVDKSEEDEETDEESKETAEETNSEQKNEEN